MHFQAPRPQQRFVDQFGPVRAAHDEHVRRLDDAVALLRVKQELEETFAMREATAAQLRLRQGDPALYEPAFAKQRAQAAALTLPRRSPTKTTKKRDESRKIGSACSEASMAPL